MNVVLGVTGSVASILAPKLSSALVDAGHNVKLVFTSSAKYFAQDQRHLPINLTDQNSLWKLYSNAYKVNYNQFFDDSREWQWSKKGDPVQHIELANWMDVLLIAPLTANTMAKMVHGICDNLLLSIWLAKGDKPVVVAPSMNTKMLTHPVTQDNLIKLMNFGVKIISPVEKTLACGETGVGAMAPIDQIVKEIS